MCKGVGQKEFRSGEEREIIGVINKWGERDRWRERHRDRADKLQNPKRKKNFNRETSFQGNNYSAGKQLQSKGYLLIMIEFFLFPAYQILDRGAQIRSFFSLPFDSISVHPFDCKMKRDGLRNCQEENFSKAMTFNDFQSSCENKGSEEMGPQPLPKHPSFAKNFKHSDVKFSSFF